MLADFIKAIVDLTRRSDCIEVHDHGETRQHFVRQGENYTVLPYSPNPRSSCYHSLEDFSLAVLDGKVCGDPEVYHGHRGVVAFVDRGSRHDAIKMPLVESERFAFLRKLGSDGDGSPASLIRQLRFRLPGSGVDVLVKALAKIDFTLTRGGVHVNEHGREQLGKSIEAEVRQAADIPEVINILVPVYGNHGLRDLSSVSVQVGVFLDVQNERVVLEPLADEIDRAINNAQVAIGVALRDAMPEVPIFYGAPA